MKYEIKKENSRSHLNVVDVVGDEWDGSASLTLVFGIAFTTHRMRGLDNEAGEWIILILLFGFSVGRESESVSDIQPF